MAKTGPKPSSRYARVFRHINKTDKCWLWTGKRDKNDEYGIIHEGQKSFLVHRVVFELYNGPIPDGMLVCHKCDNPPCCNPSHLFLGDHDANAKDMVSKGRQAHGETNSRVTLTQEKVNQIREMNKQGYTNKQLSDIFQVNPATISKINTRRIWK